MTTDKRQSLVSLFPMPGAVILAVDDTPSHLRLLRNLITSVGGQVFEAESAEMARVQLMRVSPDVILLDIDMPGMDGLTFCRELKANPSLSHTPVIFLSGTADDFDKVEAFLSGGADFIGKPFHPADVLARVSHHVKMVRAQQALKEEKEILSKLNEQLVMAHQETADVFGVLAEQIRGKLIGGKYHLEARIGSGGFSVVYRADEVVTGNKVAVKILRPGNPQGAAMRVQRFAQEASSCMRIQHLNVIKILDSATTPDGFTYLVMELLEGHPLSEEIRRGYPLSLQRSLEIILPVCDVLLAAHNVGVLHRDIKPSNIFLHKQKEGEIVKVLDFGIAKLLTDDGQHRLDSTQTGEVIGTLNYMSPEQRLGMRCDGRTDVFSTGVVLYEMLTSQLPFQRHVQMMATDPPGVLPDERNQTLAPASTHNPAVPAAIDELIAWALTREPTARPTMSEFLHRLRSTCSELFGTGLSFQQSTRSSNE